MTHQRLESASETPQEAALCQAARRLLEQAAHDLDPEIEQRLRAMRLHALARRSGPRVNPVRHSRMSGTTSTENNWAAKVNARLGLFMQPGWQVAWPGAAFASLAVALLAVNIWLAGPPAEAPQQALAEEELEILEDLEFYAWLEWQHWQPLISAPAS